MGFKKQQPAGNKNLGQVRWQNLGDGDANQQSWWVKID